MSSDLGAWQGGGGGPFFSTPFSSDPWDPWDYGGNKKDAAADLPHANVDWRETDSGHIFRVDLPGVKKEDLKVQVEDGNFLHISGNRSVEKVEENRVERGRGSFSRKFRLPENANVEEIKCGLEHGVLTVEVAKKEVQVHHQPTYVRYIDVA